MKRTLIAAVVLSSSLSLAQSANDNTTASAEAGVAVKKGPDITRMPFTADSVKQVVAFHQDLIQGCYERTMKEKEKVVEGKLMTSWTITAEGLVKNAKVHKKGTSVRDPELHQCVEAVILSMTFPSPGTNKEVPIEFPFNLKPVH